MFQFTRDFTNTQWPLSLGSLWYTLKIQQMDTTSVGVKVHTILVSTLVSPLLPSFEAIMANENLKEKHQREQLNDLGDFLENYTWEKPQVFLFKT